MGQGSNAAMGCFGGAVAAMLGVIVVVLVLIGGVVLLMGKACADVGQQMAADEAADQAAVAAMTFEDVEVVRERSWIYVRGAVRNNSDRPVDFVKVNVEWLAADGTVVDTDFAYAVGGDTLQPGQARKFEVMSRGDDRIKSANYHLSVD